MFHSCKWIPSSSVSLIPSKGFPFSSNQIYLVLSILKKIIIPFFVLFHSCKWIPSSSVSLIPSKGFPFSSNQIYLVLSILKKIIIPFFVLFHSCKWIPSSSVSLIPSKGLVQVIRISPLFTCTFFFFNFEAWPTDPQTGSKLKPYLDCYLVNSLRNIDKLKIFTKIWHFVGISRIEFLYM